MILESNTMLIINMSIISFPISKKYPLTIDWNGHIFYGIHLDWDYSYYQTVTLPMPNYIKKIPSLGSNTNYHHLLNIHPHPSWTQSQQYAPSAHSYKCVVPLQKPDHKQEFITTFPTHHYYQFAPTIHHQQSAHNAPTYVNTRIINDVVSSAGT